MTDTQNEVLEIEQQETEAQALTTPEAEQELAVIPLRGMLIFPIQKIIWI